MARDSVARRLRRTPTTPEVRLWRLLFPLRTGGYHFRKQAPIGPYVVDFACHHARLVIEVDGERHATASGVRRDAERDGSLEGEGYRVLRFTNEEVMRNPEGVYHEITRVLEETPSPALPTRACARERASATRVGRVSGRAGRRMP